MNPPPSAWVAGGRGAIGAACAERLTSEGYEVHVSDRPDEDLTTPDQAEGVATRLGAGAGVDVAVHAIGLSGRRFGDGAVSGCTDAGWQHVLDVDLTSAFRFLRANLRHANDGASLVLIGSALATTLDHDFLTVAYRVAKAGLIPLMEAAAYEGASRGIRVNVVAPGLVDTPMAARALDDEHIRSRFGELMPLGRRPATVHEVASAVAWLAGQGSAQTTGTIIPVDGGWHLQARVPQEV